MKFFWNNIIFLFPQLLYCQDAWYKLPGQNQAKIESMVRFHDSLIYFGISGKRDIYQYNIKTQKYIDISFFDNVYSPFTDSKQFIVLDSSLYIVHNYSSIGLIYKLVNNKFVSVQTDSRLSMPYVGNNVKLSNDKEIYFSELSSIYKYKYNWYIDESIEIYRASPGEKIVNYFFLPNSKLIILISSNGIMKIYELDLKSNKVNLVDSFQADGIIDKNCNLENKILFFPTIDLGLLSYDLEHNKLVKISIDTFSSKMYNIIYAYSYSDEYRKHAIVINDKLFESNDGGNTWKLLYKGLDEVDNLVIDLIINGDDKITLIKEKCAYKSAELFSNVQNKFQQIIPEINVGDYYKIEEMGSGRLISNLGSCNNLYSDDNGKNWISLKLPEIMDFGVVRFNNSSLIGFENQKYKVNFYVSTNEGNSWLKIKIPKGYVKNFFNINDSYVLGVSYDNITTVDGITYISYSEDGKNWKLINSFVNLPFSFENIIPDEVGNLISYNFKSTLVYYSKDTGRSWSIDPRFKDFERIAAVYFKNSNIYVSGAYKGVQGLYIYQNNFEFKLLNDIFTNILPAFFYIDSLKYITISLEQGVLITKDGGLSWQEFESGIISDPYQRRYYNSINYTNSNNLYISITDNGIYKTVTPLVSVKNLYSSSNAFIEAIPNPTSGICRLLLSEKVQDYKIRIQVANQLGQELSRECLNDKREIDLRLFPNGLYFIKIIQGQEVIGNCRVVKVN